MRTRSSERVERQRARRAPSTEHDQVSGARSYARVIAVVMIVGALIFSAVIFTIPHGAMASEPLTFTIENPYLNLANNFKVQLHAHTTESDGTLTPTEVMTLYKSYGFAAVAITDHDEVTADPSVSGIIHISGDEFSPATEHKIGLGITSHITGTHQEQIDGTNDDGGIVFLSHPNNSVLTWTTGEIDAVDDYRGIEIFTGLLGLSSISQCYAEDKAFHAIADDPTRLVIAVDDSHSAASVYRGWIEINTDALIGALTEETILGIIDDGNYLSMQWWNQTDPYPASLEISVTNMTITVDANVTTDIMFYTANGLEQTNASATEGVFTVTSWDQQYVLVKAKTGSNPYSYTWSNPLYFSADTPLFDGDIFVFTGEGLDALASNDDNWRVHGDWSNQTAPTAGSNVLFNTTSGAEACTWDITTTLGVMWSTTGYTGTLTQACNLNFESIVWETGVLTASASYSIYLSGDMEVTGGTVTANVAQIVMNGTDTTLTWYSTSSIKKLTINGDVTITRSGGVHVYISNTLTIATGASLEIYAAKAVILWPVTTYSNLGSITGASAAYLGFWLTSNYTLTLGEVSSPVYMVTASNAAGNRVLTLAEDTEIGNSMQVYSEHATYTCTLNGNDFELSAAGSVTIGTRGAITANKLDLVITAAGTYTAGPTNALKSLRVSADVTATTAGTHIYNNGLIVDAEKTLTIGTGKAFLVNFAGGTSIQNNGTITGAASSHLDLYCHVSNQSIAPGDVDCPVRVITGVAATGNFTLTMNQDAEFASTLNVYSDHATYVSTLSLGDATLEVDGVVTLSAGGVLKGGTGTLMCGDDFEGGNGTLDSEDSLIVMLTNDTYALAPSGYGFNVVRANSTAIDIIFDTASGIGWYGDSCYVVVYPSTEQTAVVSEPDGDTLLIFTLTEGNYSLSVAGLSNEMGYKVYQDGEEIYRQDKGFEDISFTAEGGGTFRVETWEMPMYTPLNAAFSYTHVGWVYYFEDHSYGDDLVSWLWNFGDGFGSSSRSPMHRYTDPGVYTVTLTVYDAEGHSSTAKGTITIELSSDQPFDETDEGWTVYISDKLMLNFPAVGLLIVGIFFIGLGRFGPELPLLTRQGRVLIGVLMLLAAAYWFLFSKHAII